MQDKIFITGANGQLGRDLVHELTGRGVSCVASDIQPEFFGDEECEYIPLDITDSDSVDSAMRESGAGRVIHCAAWTAVDSAEDDANRAKVYAVNVIGTENIAKACAEHNLIMTYISTDYILTARERIPESLMTSHFPR